MIGQKIQFNLFRLSGKSAFPLVQRKKNYRKLQMVSAPGVLSHGVMLIYNLGQRKQLNQL